MYLLFLKSYPLASFASPTTLFRTTRAQHMKGKIILPRGMSAEIRGCAGEHNASTSRILGSLVISTLHHHGASDISPWAHKTKFVRSSEDS